MPSKSWIRTSSLLLAVAVVLALSPPLAHAQSKDDLLKQADALMYEEKQRKKAAVSEP